MTHVFGVFPVNNPPAAHPRGIRAPQGSPNVVLGAMHAILAPSKSVESFTKLS